MELICPPVLLHILPTYVMFSATSSLGNTLIIQKILFCVDQTMLSLGIFIDLKKWEEMMNLCNRLVVTKQLKLVLCMLSVYNRGLSGLRNNNNNDKNVPLKIIGYKDLKRVRKKSQCKKKNYDSRPLLKN